MKKAAKKLLTFVMAAAMLIGSVPMSAFAADTENTSSDFKLDDGYYQSLLDITDWSESQEVKSGLRISQRGYIIEMSDGAMNCLQVQVTGYSQYDAIYMVKQDADNVSEIDLSNGGKIGEWSDITNYEKLKEEGYVDEKLNDSFVKLEPDEVNKTLDTAVFTLNNWSGYNFDCTKKVGLVGCLKKEMSSIASQCNSITFKVNPAFTKTTKLMSYIDYGETDLPLSMNINTWGYGNVNTIGQSTVWNQKSSSMEIATSNSLKESAVSNVTYEIESGKLKAKIFLTDEFKDAGTVVNEAVSRDSSSATTVAKYKGYLAGNFGITWGTDNLYNEKDNCIEVEFNANELMYGKEIKFYTTSMKKYYETANICLSEYDYGPATLKNDEYGLMYRNGIKQLEGNVNFGVELNQDKEAIENAKTVCGEGLYNVYTINLKKNDELYTPSIAGQILIPVPDGWDIDSTKLYAAVTFKQEVDGKDYLTIDSTYPDVIKAVTIDGHDYLKYNVSNANKEDVLHGGSIIIGQIKQKQDVTKLETGLYKVETGFVKAGTQAETSMANGTLDSQAYLKVDEDGNREVYLNFHSLDMGGGTLAYMGALWNNDDSDVTYYDYETDENGALLDNAGFDAITEFPCVKATKIKLSDSTWDAENLNYQFKVIPPGMGEGMEYSYVYSKPIDADLVFFSAEKVDDSTVQIPTYQKSVLRKSIDKAERYAESSYSSDSWATLKSALEDGKAYYDTLAGKDAGTDATISNTIKEKSDAIENAIKALEENPELVAARENLKKAIDEARKVELGNKTVSAFNELTAAINSAQATYEKSNVTVDELNKQVETLNAAVETFNNSADASKLNPTNLEDGDYKVYVDMKKIDKATDSMSNNAIDHWINLNVKNGVYTATLDFKGMTVSGQFGYLQTLKYYDAGYTYDSMGNPQGTLKDTTVLSTQKDAQGNDIIDSFNDKDNLYPDTMSFPLVDKGTQEFVPLQVFVPLMESLTAGTGTQDVLMRIDWTSLKKADDDTQEEIALEDGLYTVSSDLREAGSDEKSAFNDYLEKVRLIAKDGKITAYIDFKSNGEGADETYVTDISIVGGSGQAANGKLDRAELTLPQNVEFTKVKLTDNTGKTVDARLYLDLRNAVKQSADNKATLQEFIAKAENIKKDGKIYTEASLKVLEDALAAAKTVNNDAVAINEEINAAGRTLENAINTLEEVKKTADKTALEAKIKEAETIDNKENVYTEDSYKQLTDAISTAKKVLANENAEQSEVDSQVTLLQAAIDGLQKEAVLNRADLKAVIEKAEALNDKANTFTKDSWDALYVVYNTAVQVYQDKNATQDQIDAQVKALQAAIDALVPVSNGELADGVYEIKGEFQKAEDKTKLSMADGALSYTETTDADGNTVKTKDPLYLVVKDGKISVRMHFVPLTSDWNGTAFTGYLGEIKYYPDYDDTDALPGKDEKLADVNVEYSYIGYDEYNDPNWGSDSYIKGKSYPEVVSIPVELNDNEIWVQVYVPVMEGIAAGNGTQKARLSLDWSSVKQVRDDSIDVSELEKQIGYAKAVEKGTASDATWEALQQAIVSAQAVYDNLSSTQEQIDAQITLLQKAMAAVASENGKKADKTQLQALIGTANEKLAQTDVYTEDSLKTLQTILLYAQGVYDNNDADQTSVDAAAKALKSALDGLTEIKTVDTSALETELSKAEALVAKTDVYTEETLNTLQIAINNAKRVLADENHTQDAVDKQVTALQNAQLGLIKKVYADKTSLKAKLDDAKNYTTNESAYTASSMAALKTAISNAETVYADENASQATVDAQTKALEKAIAALVKAGDNTQDITKLADGVYSITGTMVKVDKTSASMSNEAINHTIKLTVKNGKYYITLNFNGLTVGQKLGYLSKLKYFTTGYTLDKYGNPQGTLADVTVDSYQKNADGSLVSDTYGSNYPDEVTFELIPEALEDGYVPLQVFVPIMDAISAGTGTQPVFLKLDWSSLKATTADDPDFDKNDNNNNNNGNVNGSITNGSSLGNGQLGNNTLGNSSLGSSLGSGSSLKSGASSLGSGSNLKSASSVKTADMDLNQMRILWAAVIVAAAAMAFGFAGFFRRRRNGEEQ